MYMNSGIVPVISTDKTRAMNVLKFQEQFACTHKNVILFFPSFEVIFHSFVLILLFSSQRLDTCLWFFHPKIINL